jgi:acyl-CoA thioester hydrolase
MFKVKVYYEDTDSGGVVYYANYLKYLERARTEFLFEGGFTHTKLKDMYNIFIIVKSCNIDYLKPAFLDDKLNVITLVEKKSKVQIILIQKIFRGETLIIEAKIKVAIVNTEGKVTRMPESLFNIF